MIHKRILVSERVRCPPREGFSWVDRRFVREFASKLSHDAIVLYFFLAAVSDKHGLSYYRDTSIAVRLRLSEKAVEAARSELLAQDLVAYRLPLTQVLSLPRARPVQRGGLHALGDVLQQLGRDSLRKE